MIPYTWKLESIQKKKSHVLIYSIGLYTKWSTSSVGQHFIYRINFYLKLIKFALYIILFDFFLLTDSRWTRSLDCCNYCTTRDEKLVFFSFLPSQCRFLTSSLTCRFKKVVKIVENNFMNDFVRLHCYIH